MGEQVVALLERGTITPHVGRVLPIEQTGEAHRLILEPGAHGKIVIQVEPTSADPTPQ
jgi:NADPH:quinone reductase-like Zn-dependent oxidoreductase